MVVNLFKDTLQVEVNSSDLDRVHRIGQRRSKSAQLGKTRSQGRADSRPVIVKFVSYKVRKLVYANKKKLAGSGVTIREDLTSARLDLYKQVVQKFSFKNVWSADGRILFRADNEVRSVATVKEFLQYAK